MRHDLIRTAALLLALTAAAPASAASTATMRIVAYVPVQCDVRLVGSSVEQGRVTVSFTRACNTGHALIVSSEPVDGVGPLTITDVKSGRSVAGPHAVFHEPERYVNQVEQVVLDCPDASSAAVQQLASGVRIAVEPT